jgi:hypothetical protein
MVSYQSVARSLKGSNLIMVPLHSGRQVMKFGVFFPKLAGTKLVVLSPVDGQLLALFLCRSPD